MAIASRLKWFLDVNRTEYDLLPGEVPEAQRVVSHIFHDAHGYLMVVHPASRKIAISALQELMGRPLHPAREKAVRDIFFDCQRGAIPPVGPAYGIPTIVDDSISADGDVYFRGGDDEDWVHMTGAEFQHLVAEERHAAVATSA
jgi:Ala-tRNA(Pro) deacylase